MIITLAALSVYQSYVILIYQQNFSKIVWAAQTIELDYQAQRDAWLACEDKKWVRM